MLYSDRSRKSPRIAYVDQQRRVEGQHRGAAIDNNDIVGSASYNIFVGIAVASIFGAGFFFDIFWPERRESKSVRLECKSCAVVVTIMALSDALAFTIIVATRSASITGVDANVAKEP
ncbi:MAG: hypothetical protein M1837_001895 [Sclerophora amabilis]|nr:MAG: hypothetical protein M1837_001895 [Sclerophora amabilis]